MAQHSCPGCRLRFSPATATNLTMCPYCGRPLEQPAGAASVLGYRLVDAGRLESPGVSALASAIAALPPRHDAS